MSGRFREGSGEVCRKRLQGPMGGPLWCQAQLSNRSVDWRFSEKEAVLRAFLRDFQSQVGPPHALMLRRVVVGELHYRLEFQRGYRCEGSFPSVLVGAGGRGGRNRLVVEERGSRREG